jgi:hypothetical protein
VYLLSQDSDKREGAAVKRLGLSDFTVCDESGVEIGGARFPHRLYQFALAHSGWRHAALEFNENGSMGSRHDSLKTARGQGLRLRGSRVFDNVEAYEAFVGQIVQRFDARVAKRLADVRPLHCEDDAVQRSQPAHWAPARGASVREPHPSKNRFTQEQESDAISEGLARRRWCTRERMGGGP